jgi:hypothetical protein
MTTTPTTPANWYPDPWGRHEFRYWDGFQWTEHVASHGKPRVDPPSGQPKTVVGAQSAAKVQKQVQRHAGITTGGAIGTSGNAIFDASVLVVNQKMKLIEINNEYAIFDDQGSQIGMVRQVGQSNAKKAMRLFASVDQFLTHKLQVVDMAGNVVLAITRPAKVVKSRVLIHGGVFGKIRFALNAGGQKIGSLRA